MFGYAKEVCFLNFENKLRKKLYNHILNLSKTQHEASCGPIWLKVTVLNDCTML